MKTRLTVYVMAAVIALGTSPVPSRVVTIQDGGHHRLAESYFSVCVRNNFQDKSTPVEIVAGTSMWHLYAYDDSNVTVSGGRYGKMFGSTTTAT